MQRKIPTDANTFTAKQHDNVIARIMRYFENHDTITDPNGVEWYRSKENRDQWFIGSHDVGINVKTTRELAAFYYDET